MERRLRYYLCLIALLALAAGPASALDMEQVQKLLAPDGEANDGLGRTVSIDLKAMVMEIKLLAPQSAEMLLRADTGKSLRPADILREVFQFKPESLKSARVTKTRSVY